MSNGATKRGFLIMPFDERLAWLHELVIHASVAENLHTRRGDDIAKPGVIFEQILQDIDEADVIFGVCTGRNANVFLELGYAWRNHKPILIAEDTHDLPFDVAAYRTLLYGRQRAGADRETLPFRLRRAIQGILTPNHAARLTALLQNTGRSCRLIVTNAGTVTLHNVTVSVPDEVEGFRIFSDDLPIDVMRPDDRVSLLASITMGGGPRIFDVTMTAETKQGEPMEFVSKISL